MEKVVFELDFEGFVRFVYEEKNGEELLGDWNSVNKRKVGGRSFQRVV